MRSLFIHNVFLKHHVQARLKLISIKEKSTMYILYIVQFYKHIDKNLFFFWSVNNINFIFLQALVTVMVLVRYISKQH